MYIDAIILLVKCCNLKSQVLNKSSFVKQFSVRTSANLTDATISQKKKKN